MSLRYGIAWALVVCSLGGCRSADDDWGWKKFEAREPVPWLPGTRVGVKPDVLISRDDMNVPDFRLKRVSAREHSVSTDGTITVHADVVNRGSQDATGLDFYVEVTVLNASGAELVSGSRTTRHPDVFRASERDSNGMVTTAYPVEDLPVIDLASPNGVKYLIVDVQADPLFWSQWPTTWFTAFNGRYYEQRETNNGRHTRLRWEENDLGPGGQPQTKDGIWNSREEGHWRRDPGEDYGRPSWRP